MGFFSSIFKSQKTKDGEANFDKLVKELIANPTDTGIDKLEEAKKEYNLKPEFCKKVIHDNFKALVDASLEDARLDDEEYEKIVDAIDTLGIDVNEVRESALTAWRKHQIYLIEEKNIMKPCNADVEIVLKKGENVYLAQAAYLKKEKTRTQRVNFSGPVVNFRICKGLSYRAGSMKIQHETVTFIETLDYGNLILTDRRIVYSGSKKNFSYPYDKIMRIEMSNIGLIIHKENLATPQIIEMDDYELALVILSRMLNQ